MGARVRLTRRGRMLVLSLLMVFMAGTMMLFAQPGQAADPPAAPPSTVVQPGETLWSIAADYAPGRDRAATIDDIRRLNHLHGYRIWAGQRLTLPRLD